MAPGSSLKRLSRFLPANRGARTLLARPRSVGPPPDQALSESVTLPAIGGADGLHRLVGRCVRFPALGGEPCRVSARVGGSWHVVYLVIIFLVAATGITRLWLQQRREQSRMDTIQGFNSALQAMSPPARMPRRRTGRPARRRVQRRPLIQGWFVARPSGEEIRRRVTQRSVRARRSTRVTGFNERRAQSQGASRHERYAG
jgi:hypothetical protein